jgi:hypothetical protein
MLAAAIALIAWLSIAAQADLTIDRALLRGLSVIDGLARLSSYLTNLTVLLTAICFTSVATRSRRPLARFFRHPTAVTAVVVYIVFVGIAYNILLRYLWTPSGYRAWVNEVLHSVVPALAALYWLLFVPRFHVTARHCLMWLAYPMGYLLVTLARGSVSDFYPYPFINVTELGFAHALLNAALLVLAFMTLMGIFIAINRRRPDLTIPEDVQSDTRRG